ncbi:transforming growth factor-beta-induced protein ig-h3-like isoform X2 [Homarus americanus]|uniref:transforming growth factor-beta-induced protein ig-h3-like isoform X2 n=1 Tax=Homarus americanus TaxID=6706 RepID=UPI001C47049C|nr:transforming growth factor-beta-induced protein ig-h3-like isoform X2 [Homarus americanus]
MPLQRRPSPFLLLLLLLLPPPSRTQQPVKRYHLSPSGTYYFTSNPSLVYKPGRDVCVVEEVPALNLTFPLPWTHGSFCTHPTNLRQQCCEGYTVAALERGCPVVKHVKDVLATGRDLGGGDRFLSMIHRYLLPRLLTSRTSAFTLLLPLDEGFRSLEERTWSELGRVVEVEGWTGPPLLPYHVLPRRWTTTQLHHGQRLPTLLEDHPLTVTKLSNKMVLLNCVAVHRVDVHARDGVVHVISKPLPPAYTKTLADLVSADPKLTMFFTILGYADLVAWVRRTSPLTILAPTNAAFDLLPRRFIDSITYDMKYSPALQALARQHLVDGVECSLGLRTKVRLNTLEGRSLPVSCSASLTLTVGRATITTADVITSNGVLHYIDRVLIPPMALSLMQVARRAGATRFVQLVRKVGLFKDLVSFGPYTVFAPSNQALRALNRSVLRDRATLKKVVLYHITKGAQASYNLKDNQVLPSRLPGASLRVKIHPKAGIWLWRELSQGAGPYTLLVVPDEDIETWATDTFTYYRIINDPRLLNQSLNTHLLEDLVMPRALQEGSTSLLRSRHSSRAALHLTVSQGRLSLRHASVSDDFILCTNGIILFIDTLLFP